MIAFKSRWMIGKNPKFIPGEKVADVKKSRLKDQINNGFADAQMVFGHPEK
jgi:hypothetical protein